MARSRIVIADDHPHMLAAVADLLRTEFEVVAAVADGQSAVDAACVLQPDLVILDISMPVMNGLEAAEVIADLECAPRMLFLTVHDAPEYAEAARGVGARGYVLKRAIAADLLPAVRRVLAGEQAFPTWASDEIPQQLNGR
jgi:DNA-binding NarL/FixJ family response regulator